MSTQNSKLSLEDQYRRLATALPTLGMQNIDLLGQTYVLTDLVQLFESRVTASEATKTAKSQFHAAVTNERTLNTKVRALRQAIKGLLEARFGKNSQKLVEFGFVKTPRVPLDSKVKAKANAKATRAARHTMGKKQKSRIRGKGTAAPSPDNGGSSPSGGASSANGTGPTAKSG